MLALCFSILLFIALVLLQERNYFSMILGLIVLGNAVILSIFLHANPEIGQFAFIVKDDTPVNANDPLPQALVLTAIVIGFALAGFVIALIKTIMRAIGPVDSDAMTVEHTGE